MVEEIILGSFLIVVRSERGMVSGIDLFKKSWNWLEEVEIFFRYVNFYYLEKKIIGFLM